jgi:nicotinamide riboside kinase
VLLGGESTGKTTLAAALAARFGGAPVAEYGRERWEVQGGHLDEADLLAIAREQVRREDLAARSADPVLVCDTSPLTTFGYAHWRHGRADPALAALAGRRYTLSVLCGDEIPFDQDGTRRDVAFRSRQQGWYREQLAARGDRTLEVHGPVPERVEEVMRALAAR